MRPTDKNRIQYDNETNQTIDGIIYNADVLKRITTKEAQDIWLGFAETALNALASNADLTANNSPVFLTDEAQMMADRMLVGFIHRFRNGQ